MNMLDVDAIEHEYNDYPIVSAWSLHGHIPALIARVRELEASTQKAWDELARVSANLNEELDKAQMRVRELEAKR